MVSIYPFFPGRYYFFVDDDIAVIRSMSSDNQEDTFCIFWPKNSLGWSVHLWRHGYKIMYSHSLVYKCLIILVPVILGVLLIKLKGESFTQKDSVIVIAILFLINFWVLLPWRFYIDRKKEILKILWFQIPFSQLMLLITNTKDGGCYVLHAHHKKRSILFPLIWESADKSEVFRVMETIFGATILKDDVEETGSFSYKQKVGSTVYVNTLEKIRHNKKRNKESYKFRCLSLPASSGAKDMPASVEKP
jgi:hypothetical protein